MLVPLNILFPFFIAELSCESSCGRLHLKYVLYRSIRAVWDTTSTPQLMHIAIFHDYNVMVVRSIPYLSGLCELHSEPLGAFQNHLVQAQREFRLT